MGASTALSEEGRSWQQLLACAAAIGLIVLEVVAEVSGTRRAAVPWLVLWGIVVLSIEGPLWIRCSGGDCSSSAGAAALNHERRDGVAEPDWLPNSDPETQQRHAESTSTSSLRSWWEAYVLSLGCCVSDGRFQDAGDRLASPIARTVLEHIPLDDAPVSRQHRELRDRLSDLLGPPGRTTPLQENSEASDAIRTLQCFGGERNCLSRFLRARKLDVDASERMLRNTIEYRQGMRVNSLLWDPGARKVWKSLRPVWPMSAVLFTKEGNPVTYCRMAHLLRLWTLGIELDKICLLYLSYMERNLQLQREGFKRIIKVQGSSADMPKSIEIYDFQGMKMSHATCLGGIRMMGKVMRIGQDHYPENLGKAIFLNVPSFCVAAFNAFVKRVFDARTQQNFAVLSGESREELRQILQVGPGDVDRLFRSIIPVTGQEDCRGPGVLGEPDLLAP